MFQNPYKNIALKYEKHKKMSSKLAAFYGHFGTKCLPYGVMGDEIGVTVPKLPTVGAYRFAC